MSSISCLEMHNKKNGLNELYLVKVPNLSDSERKIIEDVREIEKKQGQIMRHYGMKLSFYHSHDEQPGIPYPRISIGPAFASIEKTSSGLAVVENFLYLVGGSFHVYHPTFELSNSSKKEKLPLYSTNVQCCEFSLSDLSIRSVRSIPGMKSPRFNPAVLGLDHKLYVLGGLDSKADEKGAWIEVFDPILQEWTDIPDPPVKNPTPSFDSFNGFACAAVEHSKEIFLATRYEICFFSVEKNAWHRTIQRGMKPHVWGQAMVIGQILYWFYADQITLFAYDLQTDKWMSDCMTAVSSRIQYHNIKLARASGDSLCLLWKSSSHLHCFRFRVSFTEDSFPFADVECCILGESPTATSVRRCWFVGEESVSEES